jgi:hypothetical protein
MRNKLRPAILPDSRGLTNGWETLAGHVCLQQQMRLYAMDGYPPTLAKIVQ